ncbi:alpha/beta fold hydrolase [Nocardia sp. NPDC050412]|uniref:alpha/beta fold hydrolase n=1 Tax=Nocardia sp. NPDC050412 TaxID=3364320 RepID=UPI0037AA43E6
MPYFTAADGTELAYEDYGTGTPLVFLASWALNAEMWEYQVPYFLEQGYRCVLLDRRGHGRSDRPSSGYDADTRADDAATLIDHLDLRDIMLVAHSAGGGEAVRYLARHGHDRVAGLVLLATTLPYLELTEDNPEGVPAALCDATVAELRRDRPNWFARRAQTYFATQFNAVSPAVVDNEVRRCLSAAPFALTAVWQATFATDFRPDLRELSVPTLIVHGGVDQSAPVDRTSRRVAKLLLHADFREYPTAGHGLYITHAEQLNNDIHEFLVDHATVAPPSCVTDEVAPPGPIIDSHESSSEATNTGAQPRCSAMDVGNGVAS